jgi:hypothetical protein
MKYTTVEYIVQRFSSNNGVEEVVLCHTEIAVLAARDQLKLNHPEWDLEAIKRTTIEELV